MAPSGHSGFKIDFVETKAGETVKRPKAGNVRKLFGCLTHEGASLTIEHGSSDWQGCCRRFQAFSFLIAPHTWNVSTTGPATQPPNKPRTRSRR